MRVRIGDDCVLVQHGETPVHRRVGRQTGFYGEDVGEHVFKTFFQGVKPGTRAQDRKMWGPDMRGYKEYLVTRFQTNFHQVPAVQAEDGASV